MKKYAYQIPESRKVRYLIHTDCKNEADDAYTVAHCLLTPMLDVKGIIGGHFNTCFGRFPDGTTAKESCDEIMRVLNAMDLVGEYAVKCGSAYPLQDEYTPNDSEGVQMIIDEAMKNDDRPLYIGMQGALTDLASAILIKPEICSRMTAIWVGGGAYPDGGQEFNLMQDIAAANVVMKSSMPLWQIPSNVYKNFAVSIAELYCKVRPYGKLGAYLYDTLIELNMQLGEQMPDFDWPHGELWGLGDEGAIAALMHEKQRTDLYHMMPAPEIDYDNMHYIYANGNREIRIYDQMDYRLTLEDMFYKIAILSGAFD